MNSSTATPAPPFCPNPHCYFHRGDRARWRFIRAGFFPRQCEPQRIQRYRCRHCRRYFSDQTFHTSYWLKRPELLAPLQSPDHNERDGGGRYWRCDWDIMTTPTSPNTRSPSQAAR